MPRPFLNALLVVAALSSACAEPVTEPQQTVDDATAALGGVQKINGVRFIALEGEATLGNLGQDLTPEATGQTFTITDYKRSFDVEGDRTRIEQTRTPNFPYFQGQAAQKLISGIDGEIGYNVAANGTATRTTNVVARDRRAEMYQYPVRLLQAALEGSTILANPRSEGGERLVDVSTNDGLTFTLAIDGTTHLPTRVQTITDHPNLGDVTIETKYADYVDVDGVKLPRRMTTTTDGVMTSDVRVTGQRINVSPLDIAAPAAAKSAEPIAGPPPAQVDVTEVAPGTWLLAGQSHHSVVVEFADHLTLIEVPQSEARTQAVIAKARTLNLDKPLTEAVSSHHHFDHSAGLRAAVAEGLTIIAQAGSGPYYKKAVERPHTIAPDALARSPKPLTLRTVDEETTLTDGTRTVVLYHVTGSPHTDTMLVAYLPKERLMIEADLFSPGAAVNPYAANFLENINRRGLKIDRIIPLHGAIAPYADLLKVAGTTTN